MKAAAGWLNSTRAAAYLDMSPGAFRVWLSRERKRPTTKVIVHWIGPRMRFKAHELDACVEQEPAKQSAKPTLRMVSR
jgi:hypothetical protein